MANFFSFIVILFTVSLLDGCTDPVGCDGNPAPEAPLVQYVDFPSCFNAQLRTDSSYCFTDSATYATWVRALQLQEPRCTDSIPQIDFGQYWLLGRFTQARGCKVQFRRRATIDAGQQLLTYLLAPRGCGACDLVGFSMNWALVHKPAPGTKLQVVLDNSLSNF